MRGVPLSCRTELQIFRSVDEPEIRLVGEIDLVTATALEEALQRVVAQGAAVTVSMRDVSFCDMTGFRVLARAGAQAQARGGWVTIADLPPALERVARLIDLRSSPGLRLD
jgi:anti-anti-sigma factor